MPLSASCNARREYGASRGWEMLRGLDSKSRELHGCHDLVSRLHRSVTSSERTGFACRHRRWGECIGGAADGRPAEALFREAAIHQDFRMGLPHTEISTPKVQPDCRL